MTTIGVSIRGATPGLMLATKNHPNTVKTLNCIVIDMGSICHSKLLLFIVLLSLMILNTMSTASSTATTTKTNIPLSLNLSSVLCNAILITRLVEMIGPMFSTTIKTCSGTTNYNPFVGGHKVVV